jgi:hypothetical protein
MDFHFTTHRSVDDPLARDEHEAAENLTVAARHYLALWREDDDLTPCQPALRFQGYREQSNGESEYHSHWRVRFLVNYKRALGPLTGGQAAEAKEIMELAAHFYALAASPATQIGGGSC